MTKKFRLITGLLAAVLAAVMLSSAVYIAVEANHTAPARAVPSATSCRSVKICSRALGLPVLLRFSPRRSGMPRAGSFPPARRLSARLLWFHSRSSFQIK